MLTSDEQTSFVRFALFGLVMVPCGLTLLGLSWRTAVGGIVAVIGGALFLAACSALASDE